MPYVKKFSQVQLTLREADDILKKECIELVRLRANEGHEDGVTGPKSLNQVEVQYQDDKGNILHPVWLCIRW